MTDPHARLTVAIPFYAGARYLDEAIRSVLAQTSDRWLLLVCDDCGPETGTDELVAQFDDPRIRYVRNERNLGMAGNWNRCLDLADTDLVTLLHHDDALLPHYVERMLESTAATGPDVVGIHCRARVIDDQGRTRFSLTDRYKRVLTQGSRRLELLAGRDGLYVLARANVIMCPTMCYRRSRLDGARFDERWRFVPDHDLYVRLLVDGLRIAYLDEELYAYRRHSESTTEALTSTMLRFEEEVQLATIIREIATDRGWTDVAQTAQRHRVIKLHLLFRIVQDLARLRGRAAARKGAFLRTLSRRHVGRRSTAGTDR